MCHSVSNVAGIIAIAGHPLDSHVTNKVHTCGMQLDSRKITAYQCVCSRSDYEKGPMSLMKGLS